MTLFNPKWSAAFRSQRPKVILVTGAPCSGKSTFVQQRAQDGDLIVDYDILAAALGATGHGDDRLRPFVQAARDAVLNGFMRNPAGVRQAWIVRCAPAADERHKYRVALGADVVVLETPPDVCRERAAAAGRPDRWMGLVDDWWAIYQRDERDRVLREVAHVEHA